MVKEEKRNESLEFISKIGAVLLPPSLVASVYGMNTAGMNEHNITDTTSLIFIVSSGIVGYLFLILKSPLSKFFLSSLFISIFAVCSMKHNLSISCPLMKGKKQEVYTQTSITSQKESHE